MNNKKLKPREEPQKELQSTFLWFKVLFILLAVVAVICVLFAVGFFNL